MQRNERSAAASRNSLRKEHRKKDETSLNSLKKRIVRLGKQTSTEPLASARKTLLIKFKNDRPPSWEQLKTLKLRPAIDSVEKFDTELKNGCDGALDILR